VDVKNSTKATNAVMKARGQERLEEQWRLDAASRTDGLAADEQGELFVPEDKTMRVNRYPESQPAKLTRRLSEYFDQVDGYQNKTGLKGHLYVWLKNEKSPERSVAISDIARTMGKNRGIAVTVGSLQKFLSTGNALKSTFGFAVGVFAFLKGGEAEAKSSETRSDVSDALPTRAEVVDAVIPDEVMLLVDAAAAFLAVDDLSPKTANKALQAAQIKNSNLTKIDGLPLVLDVSTGDLFGLNTSVLNTSNRLPSELTPLGRLNGSQVFGFFVSADHYVGFERTADNHWQMKVRVPGQGWNSLK